MSEASELLAALKVAQTLVRELWSFSGHFTIPAQMTMKEQRKVIDDAIAKAEG